MNRNVYSTILILVAIGTYFTVTKGIIDNANIVSDSNKQYVAAIDSAKQLKTNIDKLVHDYSQIDPNDITKLNSMIPENADNIRLILYMNNFAQKHGLVLNSLNVSGGYTPDSKKKQSASNSSALSNAVSPNPQLQKALISFSVSASYQQFINFLQDMEASLRVLDITHLSMSINENGVYSWSIELQTYWLNSQ